jgi:hypothetical protein
MAINATNKGVQRELIPSGNYIARCYQMLQIGTVDEMVMGTTKTLNKVRIGWELPTELKVFNPEKGEQPFVISKEFTLSMHEKSNLRKLLASWRGKDFTEEEAKSFDITKLLSVPCMINVIHKPAKTDPTRIYEEISNVSPMPKGVKCPSQINQTMLLEYENFNLDLFNSLPDFIKQKVQSSAEYKEMQSPQEKHFQNANDITEPIDDLPF